jgi:hypothetical protein
LVEASTGVASVDTEDGRTGLYRVTCELPAGATAGTHTIQVSGGGGAAGVEEGRESGSKQEWRRAGRGSNRSGGGLREGEQQEWRRAERGGATGVEEG